MDETVDPEPLVSRLFDATPAQVFKAWIEPDLVAQWWGPSGLNTPRDMVTIDPRVGGRYDLCMVQTDNGEMFLIRNEIVELIEPELLVLESDPMPEFGRPEPVVTRVQLQGDRGGTRLTLSRPYPIERQGSARSGWHSAFDKLAALLRRAG